MKSREAKRRLKRIERTRPGVDYVGSIVTITRVGDRLEACQHEISAPGHPALLMVRDPSESEAQFLARVEREQAHYEADPDGYTLPPQPTWSDAWVRNLSAQEPERRPDPPRRVLPPPEETPAPESKVIDQGRPAIVKTRSGLAEAAQERAGATTNRAELVSKLDEWATLYRGDE